MCCVGGELNGVRPAARTDKSYTCFRLFWPASFLLCNKLVIGEKLDLDFEVRVTTNSRMHRVSQGLESTRSFLFSTAVSSWSFY